MPNTFENSVYDLKQIGVCKRHQSPCFFFNLEIKYGWSIISIYNFNELIKFYIPHQCWMSPSKNCGLINSKFSSLRDQKYENDIDNILIIAA